MGQAEDLALALEERLEGSRQEPADRLATDAAGLDEAGGAEAADVPRDERLRQADVVDELGDRRLGAGKPLDDPEAVHVSEGLVEGSQGTQLLGLVDDRRDRAADAGR